MPSTGFLRRKLNVAEAKAEEHRKKSRSGRKRLAGIVAGLTVTVAMFFVLKGLAIAAGVSLPGEDGIAFWLSGPDPVSTALGAALQPVFTGRS